MVRNRNFKGKGKNSNQNGKNNRDANKKTTEKEMKFAPQTIGNRGKYATFNSIKDEIIQDIQERYDQGSVVADCIRKDALTTLSEPVRKISRKSDPEEKAEEQEGFNIKYKNDLTIFSAAETLYKDNLRKAYSRIIRQYCTDRMRQRLEEHPDYEAKILNDPVELMRAIKVLIHDPVRAQYPFATMTDAVARWINAKQQDNEELMDYVKRWKQLRDVAKTHLGPEFLHSFIKTTSEYQTAADEKEKTKLLGDSFAQWSAYLLLRGADSNKYGSLMKGFVSQYSLGHDQYPRDTTTATDALSNHSFDPKYHQQKKKGREKENNKKKKKDSEVLEFWQHLKRNQNTTGRG